MHRAGTALDEAEVDVPVVLKITRGKEKQFCDRRRRKARGNCNTRGQELQEVGRLDLNNERRSME
jgi:hypothetical protein